MIRVNPSRKLLVSLFLLSALGSRAQGSYAERARNYIATYKDLAMEEQRRTGVPAAITLAQGIYETSAGASELAVEANNHFGIKCKREWTGLTYAHTDDAPNECFRKYASAEDSYRDHSDYLKKSPRYAACFRQPVTDYSAWATELKRAGYATNPRYAQLISKVVDDFGLQDYTYVALKPATDETVAMFTPEVVPERDAPIVPPPPSPAATASPASSSLMDYYNGMQGFYAKKGDMLLNAAVRYNVRYAKLLEWNDLSDAPLPFDQFIYLEKKPTRAGKYIHVVREGETALQVAQKEGIQLASLRALNQLEDGEEPAPGTTLHLQGGSPIKPRTYRPQVVVASVPVSAEVTAAPETKNEMIATAVGEKMADTIAVVEATVAETPRETAVVTGVPIAAVKEEAVVREEAAATETPAASTEPLSPLDRLKARMDKAVYADGKSAPATTEVAKDAASEAASVPTKSTRTKAKVVPYPATTETPTVAATPGQPKITTTIIRVPANQPKTTVSAALPKPRTDSGSRNGRAVVVPPASGARTVSAALPKDMQPAVQPTSTASVPVGNVEFHTVGRGETVFSIARKYGVSVTDLQAWNNMDFAAIRVGQQLRVKKP